MCNPSQGFYGSNNTFSPAAQAVRWVYPLSLGQVVTATVMPELSPQAQAVWDAYELVDCDAFAIDPRRAGLAAALRAVADQVVPEVTTPWNSTFTPEVSAVDVRAAIHAIAAELKAITTNHP